VQNIKLLYTDSAGANYQVTIHLFFWCKISSYCTLILQVQNIKLLYTDSAGAKY